MTKSLLPNTGGMPEFLFAWLADPFRIGAVAPSGRALARLMTCDISPDRGPVIELGAGTGAFTRALIDRGVPPERLVLIESNPRFVSYLKTSFPAARALHMDADRLHRIRLFPDETAGAVVSGLPLLSMATRKVMAVLAGSFAHLGPRGAFYQFTYGPRCPVPGIVRERLNLRAQRIGRTLANLPPAAVYRLSRRHPELAAATCFPRTYTPK
jgi:phosphatidylethanolamine/phosphatidyl-N-methylethanolamine N-methyltransferase